MSAFPLRRYRILAIETRTLMAYVEAKSANSARKQAEKVWDSDGDEPFRIKECTFDVVNVDRADV